MTASWEDWITLHSEVFLWTRDDLLKTLLRWSEIFELAGFHPWELVVATKWLAANSPPRYPSEYLSALQSRVRTNRQFETSSLSGGNPGDDHDVYTCHDCGGSGWVQVPHEFRSGGCRFETWYWLVVVCGCSVGNRVFDSWGHEKGKPMTILEYERKFPDWRAKVAAFSKFLLLRRRVSDESIRLDKLLGPLSWKKAMEVTRT